MLSHESMPVFSSSPILPVTGLCLRGGKSSNRFSSQPKLEHLVTRPLDKPFAFSCSMTRACLAEVTALHACSSSFQASVSFKLPHMHLPDMHLPDMHLPDMHLPHTCICHTCMYHTCICHTCLCHTCIYHTCMCHICMCQTCICQACIC